MVGQIFLLLLGVFAGACSIVFIKYSTLHPVLLAAYRLLSAGIILLPLFFRELKKGRRSGQITFNFKLVSPSILPGILLGLHFIFWNIGAMRTLAANATLIVNMVPIAMPFFAYFLFREVINVPELLGTVLAIGGLAVLGVSDFHIGRDTFLGDISCFIAMVFATAYMALSRKNNRGESIWIYITPLYLIGGVFCFIVSLLFTPPWANMSWVNAGTFLGLALVSTIVGHTIFNIAMRKLRSQLVTLINLIQIAFGAVLGLVFFGEIPDRSFAIATPIILTGTMLSIIFANRQGKKPGPAKTAAENE